MQIAFLGLGNMGEPMAHNLVRTGHEVVVYNRTRSRSEWLAREGATVAESPRQACTGCEAMITMLADDAAVEAVVLGSEGAAGGLPHAALHISMSTISPELVVRLAGAHRERGQAFISAPVFGRPEAAAAAKLFVVAAGEQDFLERARPIFAAVGQRTLVVGARPEMANYVKLMGNFTLMCMLENFGEVFAVARKAGVDPKTMFEVLSGTLFGSPAYNTYGPKIIGEEFVPAGFRMPLGLKDIRLALQAGEGVGVPMPFANIIRDRFLSGIARGYGDLDWSAIAMGAAESAGLGRSE